MVRFSLVTLSTCLLWASPVAAQQDAGVPAGLVPPRLVTPVEARSPDPAREATVDLAITIDATGHVTDARVITGAGARFDEAALEAARQFVFEPARRDGAPIPSRIRYRYVFRATSVPDAGAAPDAAAPPPPLAQGADAGRPPAEGPPPEQPAADSELSTYEAVATVAAPPREITRHTIDAQEMNSVAGTRGDALRAVELLPGIGRPPFGAGVLLVRGSSPQDSQAYLDGMPVPLLYHFGGLTSFFHSRLLDRIDFYPGNYSVRYGRKIGGVVDVTARDPRTDSLHGIADLNLIDMSLLVEAPITDETSFALAARRSHIDFVFSELVPEGTFAILAAPVYYDYQAIGTWKPTRDDRVRLLVYGSSDRFEIIFGEPADGDPAVRGDVDLSTQFHRAQLEWRRHLSAAVDQQLDLSIVYSDLHFSLGNVFEFDISGLSYTARSEWALRLTPRVRTIVGLDILWQPLEVRYIGPAPLQGEGDPAAAMDPLSTRDRVVAIGDLRVYHPAVYVETQLRVIDPLEVVLGLRLDWFHEIESWAFDPRLVARYTLGGGTTLKAGVGMFSQPPEIQESSRAIGNPNLGPTRALHLGAGIEQAFDEATTVSVEGFYKWITDRVVSTPNAAAPFFENNGVGRIYGLEVSGRMRPRPTSPVFGFLSYTLSRSERRDRGGPWRLFDFDQTHILTLSTVVRLGAGWEAGATFRLVTGNPSTPITGSIYDANLDVYRPLYGDTNSIRNPIFHRLDLRIEKLWRFTSWRLAVYLDVQNVYNSSNPEGVLYSYDYATSVEVSGLPILPSLGVRGEL